MPPLHDVHCHALPGIDDGARDDAECAAMLDGLAALGYARVAATPHFHRGTLGTADRSEIERLVAAIEAQRAGRPPRLVAGAELWFDERVLEPGAAAALPGYGASRILLLEFSGHPGTPPRGFERLAFELGRRGATLVLAHPERYPDVQRDPGRLDPLRRAGALIQVDLLSLSGAHGSRAREAGWSLLESGAADAVATDLHRAEDLPDVGRVLAGIGAWSAAELSRLASENPAAILDGRPGDVVRRG